MSALPTVLIPLSDPLLSRFKDTKSHEDFLLPLHLNRQRDSIFHALHTGHSMMFTSKGLFSSVSCPYNDSCALPKCLFLHSKSVAASANSDLPKPAQEIARSNNKTFETVQQNQINGASSTSLKITPRNSPGVRTALRTVRRDVSPPPLRRANENVIKEPTAKQQPTMEQVKSRIQAEVPPAKRQKVEVLNPRMLKSSPATHDLRYRLVKALHDHLVRLNTELRQDASVSEEALVLSDQALIIMALDLEETAAVEKPSIYSNVVKNQILTYKRMSLKDWKDERSKELSQKEAPKEIATSGLASDSVASGPPKPIETGLSKEEELAFIPRFYTPIASLAQYGYVPTVPTEEEIKQAQKGVEAARGWEVCDRCKSRFQVFPGRREEDGALTSGGACKYHWGKLYLQDKSASDLKAKRERRYRCCGEAVGDSAGCTQTDSHVFKVSEVKRLAALLNFEQTPENEAGSKQPVCIDGEMGYTVHGLELIRLTATLWPDGEELLDVLVRPFGEILDFNSRFSGVWPQQMADALPWTSETNDSTSTESGQNGTVEKELRIASSPAEARSLLFLQLSPQTPLIGHGLENDLNAVRIVHPIIIDTALLFPHVAGLPFRNGLKALMLKYLQRHIQVVSDDKIRGHDSKEDARAAGDLVRYRIGMEWQTMKRKGWTLENGELIEPKGQDLLKGASTGGMLTVDFLESGHAAHAAKAGTKRPLAEISQDNVEEGEIEG